MPCTVQVIYFPSCLLSSLSSAVIEPQGCSSPTWQMWTLNIYSVVMCLLKRTDDGFTWHKVWPVLTWLVQSNLYGHEPVLPIRHPTHSSQNSPSSFLSIQSLLGLIIVIQSVQHKELMTSTASTLTNSTISAAKSVNFTRSELDEISYESEHTDIFLNL